MRKFILPAVVGLFFLLLSNTNAFSYTLDGNLSDWGVTPFSHWAPTSGSTADYVEKDDIRFTGGSVWGGEPYDIEALYFDNDANYFYFAMVSSYPQNRYYAGDLGIDLNNDGRYEYGVDLTYLSPGNSIRQRQLKENPRWRRDYNYPTTMRWGTNIGMSDIFYRDAGHIEGLSFCQDGHTYILEGRISRLLFDPIPLDGSSITLSYSLTCFNDYMLLRGDIDHQPIPEPATLLLFATGILGLGGLKFKKIKKCGL